ncbi:MAG: undecaprenyl-diphosphatase UppP, partial [Anaerolineaceae bacterium]|nr:undecaprenyl-diphosphatase UppP [Anaerolineaceae bacterium]
MSFFQAIILGIVQGLTEFLPISSSAHLVLVPFFLGWTFNQQQAFTFDVIVQLGTLVAVIIYFRQDLIHIIKAFITAILHRKPFETMEARMGWFLILATIPAGIFGVLVKSQVEEAFNSPLATAVFLLVTAAFLFAAEVYGKKTRTLASFGWLDALVMGLAQAAAIFPGISRSGATISAGMARQLDRPSAARFSFLMSIPVMLAAGGLSILDLKDMPSLGSFILPLAAGFIAAGIVGYLSIHWLLKFISHSS